MTGLEHSLTAWDRSIFLAINQHVGCPVLDVVMPRVSDLGLGHVQVIALLAVALYRGRGCLSGAGLSIRERLGALFRSQRWWLAPMLLAILLSGLGAMAFKRTVERDRPFWFYTNDKAGSALRVEVRTIRGSRPLQVRGFLSGHTATSVALTTTATLLLWGRRKKILLASLWLLSAVIGISRVYVVDHWPLDVAGGAILGLVCGVAAYLLLAERKAKAAECALPEGAFHASQAAPHVGQER